MVEQGWGQQAERSNVFWIRLLALISLWCGRRCVRLVLVPVCCFYLLFARDSAAHSKRYLAKIRPSNKSFFYDLASVWKHFYTFASVSVDRFFFLAGKDDGFDIEYNGEDILKTYADKKQGCIILVSHIGSFEVMRSRAKKLGLPPLHIVLDVKHNAAAMAVLSRLNPEMAANIIDARLPPQALALELNERLAAGCMVGIMADRASAGEKQISCDFLGQQALLPAGPWLLASVLKVPVFLCVGLFLGGNRYRVAVSLLAEQVAAPRRERLGFIAGFMQTYCRSLEQELRKAPYNWFNFYNFWVNDVSEADKTITHH